MSLISRVRVKIPSGLPVMQREEPISEYTIIWSKAHIPGLETGASQIPRDDAKEGGNTEERLIDSLPYWRILHNLLLRHKLEHLTTLIFYLEG